MANGIPTTNDGSELTLGNARADALASLKQSMPNYSPMQGAASGSAAPPHGFAAPPPSIDILEQNSAPALTQDQIDSGGDSVMAAGIPPAPTKQALKANTEDNGDIGWNSAKHFLRDTFKGAGTEAANAVPRAAAKIGGWLTNAAAGAMFLGDKLTGDRTHLADAVFDFKKNYIDSAVDSWTPQRAATTGQDEGSGGAAQAIGSGMEVIPAILSGGAGLGQLISQMGTDSAMSEIDQGHQLKTAIANGTVDAVATALQATLGVPPVASVVKRVLGSMASGDLIQIGSNLVKQGVLYATGYKKEAQERSPFEGLGEATIQNAIFGAVGKPHDAGKAKPNAGDATPPPTNDAGPAPPPSPEAVAANAVSPAAAAATAPSSVPDAPTAEPLKDLRAQFRDRNDKETPRTAVFLSTANIDSLKGAKGEDAASIKGQLGHSNKIGAIVDTGNGKLVFKSVDAAKAAQDRLTAGEDPQSVIGSVTGAGSGKSPDQTVVVQGHAPEGGVAIESAVHPNDVSTAVQKVEDQNKIPVVTTPEAAVARREQEIANEQEPAKPEPAKMGLYTPAGGSEVPVHIEPGAEAGKVRIRPIDQTTGEAAADTQDVPVTQVKGADEQGAAAGESKPATEPEAPAAAPKASKVKLEPAKIKVGAMEPLPADKAGARDKSIHEEIQQRREAAGQTREELPPEPTPVAKSIAQDIADRRAAEAGAAAAPKSSSALGVLPEALRQHEEQETVPSGKKFPASLGDRQDNASAFATVLRVAAGEFKGDDAIKQRALKAAKSAENLTLKSKEATDKGRGTSHTTVKALVDEMHKAARQLIGEAKPGDEERVAPKVAEIKRKLELRRQKTTEPEKPVEKSAIKEKPKGGLSKEEQLRTNKLSHEFLHSDPNEMAGAHSKLRDWLHELSSKHEADIFPKDQINSYLQFLTDQRSELREGKDTGRMSDTVEDEESIYELDHEHGGMSYTDRPQIDESKLGQVKNAAAKKTLGEAWARLAVKTDKDGLFNALGRMRDTGQSMSSHKLLDYILKHTDTPVLTELLTQLRGRVPDAPVFNRSSMVNLASGRSSFQSAGLFHGNDRTMGIQVNFDPNGRFSTPFQLRTLVHEMVHAATKYEVENNPSSEPVKRAQMLLDVLRKRLESKYGTDVINQHLDYFNDASKPKPEDMIRGLYGITNVHEMMSEVLTNPEFAREIADSERFKSPKENLGDKFKRLITSMFHAIGQMLGIKDTRLLQHIVDNTFDVMEAQHGNRYPVTQETAGTYHDRLPRETKEALARGSTEAMGAEIALRSLGEESPKVRGVDSELRSIADDETTKTTRDFVNAFKSGAVDKLRRTQTAFKTMGQIFRDHFGDFGADGAANPLRQVQESAMHKNAIISKYREVSAPAAKKWQRLSKEDDMAVSQLMIDSTMYKLDPRQPFDKQSVTAQEMKGAEARLGDFKTRYGKLSDKAREVYDGATDANKKLQRVIRKAGVDVAIKALDLKLSDAQKGLLYGAKNPKIYDSIIGKGKLIDVGDSNTKLKNAMSDFAGYTEMEGPYHHLGRQGDYVVSAEPEGSREFNNRPEAERFARMVGEISPGSKGKVAERGGKFAVDYKAQYVSMHRTRNEAEKVRDRMQGAGLDVGLVTQKTTSGDNAPITHGMKELVTEAQRKIQKNGADVGTDAMVSSLRSAFLQMMADRSAFAGSRLARKNIGGVKASDMRRNFAEHATSSIWHAANMETVFQQAEAMATVRRMARDSQASVSQQTMYRRGQTVEALNRHIADEVNSFGHKAPFNAMMAKLGFMTYLASPSHAAIWMTQNFTTGIPVAGARWGYRKAFSSFGRSMAAVSGPAMRSTVKAVLSRSGTSEDIHNAVLDVIAKHPEFSKWMPAMKQLIDRGVISHGYADELGTAAQGKSATIERVFEWARLLPAMADSFNRVSTALTGLELTGGDIRKTSDFVQEIHADYSQQNKPLAFKSISRVWGANSITMFKTYAQEMIHLLYGNLLGTFHGQNKAESAKTLAGLVVGNALFAGVYGAIALEPLKLALYAYHKAMDDEGDVWDFENAVHRFLSDHFGKEFGGKLAGGLLPRLIGIDLSHRMALADLFFHNPPDLLSSDKDMWKNFIFDQAGPMVQDLANSTSSFMGHMQRGETFKAVSSIVPIKAYQDAMKAYDLMNGGRRDSLGTAMTKPSTYDAMVQAIGFKPASVADAQEHKGAKLEVDIKAKATKNDIVKQYVSARAQGDDTALNEAQARMDKWSDNNPTDPIRRLDIIKMMSAQQRDEQGVPDRNAKAEAAADF